MSRVVALVMALFCGLVGSAAQANPPKVEVEQYQLDNGLTVLLSKDDRLPVVAIEVMYLVGSSHERKGRTGFAHLFEHLMFQGSKHFDHEYFQPFEQIGGSVNGTTSRDRTNYFELVPRNYLELGLWMESDRMQYLLPVLTQAKLDNQRDVVKNERRQRYENQPYGMAWWYLGEALYPEGHPYRHTPIGSHADLTAADLDDVGGFFEKYYVPANAVVAVVGDIDAARTKGLIEFYFGSMAPGERAQPPNAPMPALAETVHWQKEDNVKLARIYLAWHTPALFAPGDAELDLLSTVLTEGKTSRLFYPLVYDKKIAKEVHAYQVSQKLSSTYVIEATAAPGETIETLYPALMKALEEALATPPTAAEIERAKNQYKKSFYGRIESVQSRASTLASYYLHTGRADYLSQDLARYTEASPSDVHRAAKRYIDTRRFVRIDFSPKAKASAAADGGAQ